MRKGHFSQLDTRVNLLKTLESTSGLSVRLVSDDEELYTSCREVMAEHSTGQWRITTGYPESGSDDDLYIWDWIENLTFPEFLDRSPGKNLFLVDRKRVTEFREQTPFADGNILLKPVTRPTLAAFLGLAVSAHTARISSTKSLRAVRDQMLQCVIQANLQLQEYDQDRTNFLARAVHDFRAPLTAITGYCGLLLDGALGALTDDQKDVLQRMQYSTWRLSKLAVAMFELSVGRHNGRKTELQPGDLRDALDQAIHEISPFAMEKQIEITTDLAPLDQPLYFAHEQIVQVLVNLLDNACKFAPRMGYVEIRGYPYFWERRTSGALSANGGERRARVSRIPNAYRLDVHDSGMPINPEILEEIFEEYTSYSPDGDRSGSGLGLAICRMILAQHHGKVWAENRDDGPVLSFVLPLLFAGSPDVM